MSSTGENDNDLRKILDFTRLASVAILVLHFYVSCYGWFRSQDVYSEFSDRLITGIVATGLYNGLTRSKLLSLILLIIGLLGVQGKKDATFNWKTTVAIAVCGALLFFGSGIIFSCHAAASNMVLAYVFTTIAGYLLLLLAGTKITRLITGKLNQDIFNEDNETFPQEERLLSNEYSVNFRTCYQLKGRQRNSYINIINPFRGTLIAGSPGAGKSWFLVLPAIKQCIEKGYTMFVYDFKYDDLSKPVYNWLLANKHRYKNPPSFYAINFEDLSRSHRCNPLYPEAMHDITDATESARTILLGLNREWIKKQGDFFVESPINFVTAIIWFLRKYENGKYCTLPHVIELMQAEYDELLPLLNTEAEVEVLINPFITAYKNDAMEQLEGQVASAKICMARLASPQLYWILSGNDFTLDINDPAHPKIVCIGNNPEKQTIYGAVVSLYNSRLVKLVNRKGKLKCSLWYDEAPTIYSNNLDSLIATARSNKVATFLVMQDFSQLRKDYGRDHADVIVNICGNLISGQVMGETAKVLSDRFGRIMQDRESMSINRTDTSISRSKQLEAAIPASKISALSSGQFVGMVADNPDEKIKLKMFHAEVLNDAVKMNADMKTFVDIPVVLEVTHQQILDSYFQIKYDIKQIIEKEVAVLKQARDQKK